ncbi:hypothetical protein AAVH_10336 [Aphelenchoides avenae]|nr:hypothetical protein AAVH_10336 [Aphelenchus avenae]
MRLIGDFLNGLECYSICIDWRLINRLYHSTDEFGLVVPPDGYIGSNAFCMSLESGTTEAMLDTVFAKKLVLWSRIPSDFIPAIIEEKDESEMHEP